LGRSLFDATRGSLGSLEALTREPRPPESVRTGGRPGASSRAIDWPNPTRHLFSPPWIGCARRGGGDRTRCVRVARLRLRALSAPCSGKGDGIAAPRGRQSRSAGYAEAVAR